MLSLEITQTRNLLGPNNSSMSRPPIHSRLPFPLLFLGIITLVLIIFLPLRLRLQQAKINFNEDSSSSISSIPGIAACDQNEDLFATDSTDPEEKGWDTLFNQTVSAVISADKNAALLSCTNDARVMASGSLQSLAQKLPQWKNLDRPLYESDLPQVLADYLEAYGCALEYISHSVYSDIQNKGDDNGDPLSFYESATKTVNWFLEKDVRLANAQESVRRSLEIAIGMSRFKPLDHSFTCIARASKDLRNLFGLGAEGSACLPTRVWDAHGFLRELPSD